MNVTCPRCQLLLDCSQELGGQQVACPRCGQLMQMPIIVEAESPRVVASTRRQKREGESADWSLFFVAIVLGAAFVGLAMFYSGTGGAAVQHVKSQSSRKTQERSNSPLHRQAAMAAMIKAAAHLPVDATFPSQPEVSEYGPEFIVMGTAQVRSSPMLYAIRLRPNSQSASPDWTAAYLRINGKEVWRHDDWPDRWEK